MSFTDRRPLEIKIVVETNIYIAVFLAENIEFLNKINIKQLIIKFMYTKTFFRYDYYFNHNYIFFK